jgi:hypothetical protein
MRHSMLAAVRGQGYRLIAGSIGWLPDAMKNP